MWERKSGQGREGHITLELLGGEMKSSKKKGDAICGLSFIPA